MKKQKINDPFINLVLNEEEQLIEQALENEEYEDVSNFDETKKMLEEAASQHLKLNTSKPITIRVNQLDLIKVKAKAKKNNIPYQTLLGSLINQYADGRVSLVL
jgi:predicted DNA binding CopG/RHH family protein